MATRGGGGCFWGKNAAVKNKYEIYLNNSTPLVKASETTKSPILRKMHFLHKKSSKTFLHL
jgi:hypothetical protein